MRKSRQLMQSTRSPACTAVFWDITSLTDLSLDGRTRKWAGSWQLVARSRPKSFYQLYVWHGLSMSG